jgi:mannose-6-phosphate isomerase-like protein (cupin superfamily)
MIIVHGKGRFGTKEKSVEVYPGDVLYFDPREEHYLENIGSQTLEFVWVYTKPGDEEPIKKNWIPLK